MIERDYDICFEGLIKKKYKRFWSLTGGYSIGRTKPLNHLGRLPLTRNFCGPVQKLPSSLHTRRLPENALKLIEISSSESTKLLNSETQTKNWFSRRWKSLHHFESSGVSNIMTLQQWISLFRFLNRLLASNAYRSFLFKISAPIFGRNIYTLRSWKKKPSTLQNHPTTFAKKKISTWKKKTPPQQPQQPQPSHHPQVLLNTHFFFRNSPTSPIFKTPRC